MAKKKNTMFWSFAAIVGGIILLAQLLKKVKPAAIGGLRGAMRSLLPYTDQNGVNQILRDMGEFDYKEVGEIIRSIIDARLRTTLSMPFFKTLRGTPVTGEFRVNQWRILVYVINPEEYLMLNVFKKKTNETPKNELDKAERRLSEFLSRRRSLYELS